VYMPPYHTLRYTSLRRLGGCFDIKPLLREARKPLSDINPLS